MIQISDFLRPENVFFSIPKTDKAGLVRSLTERLQISGAITDAEACFAALQERERLMTTAIGKGVAFPHAFSPAVTDTLIAYIRAPEGLDFDSVDEKPVHHIFCILGPPTSQGRHLKILARLSRLYGHEPFVEALNAAKTPEELVASVRAQELAILPPSDPGQP